MYHCSAIVDAPTVPVLPPQLVGRCFGSAALWSMLDGNVEYDVSVQVSDGECLGAHRCILAKRCCGLVSRLQTTDSADRSRHWKLDMSAHRSSVVMALLEYLYCDYCRASPDVAAGIKPLA